MKRWPFVFVAFALSRFLFLGTGALAAASLPWSKPDGLVLEPPGFLSYWAHWDGAWYLEIALEGYAARAPESTAFFPLYPMLIGAGVTVKREPALWGVLISLIATIFALYFLYRVAEKLQDEKTAKAATLAFAFFPTAFFLNAVYTEALFVALAAGSFWAAHVRRNLLLAGALGALAAATRNIGVILLIPLGYEWLRNRQEFGWRGLWEIGIVPVGLLGYMIFLWRRFGDVISFARAQDSAEWDRRLTDPLTTLYMGWIEAKKGGGYLLDPSALFFDWAPDASWAVSNTVNLAFLALFLVLLGVGLYVLPWGLWVYSFLLLLPILLTPSFKLPPLTSLPRFMLAALPLFLVAGYLFSRSRPALLYVWLLVSACFGVALTAMFVTWRWVA